MSDPTIIRVTPADGVPEYVIEEMLEETRRRAVPVPVLYEDATVTRPEIAEWVRELVADSVKHRTPTGDPIIKRGRSLLLLGPVGTGKTWNAWGAVRALTVSGVHFRVRFTTITRMFLDLEPSSGLDFGDEWSRFCEVGTLILDDLGAGKNSGRREELLTELISVRNDNQRPTMITTNVGSRPGESLRDTVGERIASRLEQMCTPVMFTGPDLRRGVPGVR